MNLFYEEYPKTLEICGEPIPIVTDFREYIKLLDMIKDEEVSDEEKAFLCQNTSCWKLVILKKRY